jgi:pimeloyl-ACP methyl ester carboxylesterase
MQWYFHPRISNTFKAEHMVTVCAPQSPEPYRRETGFIYSQGAPQAFKGDLAYYLDEHDLTDTAKDIDTARCPVHILNGEYDYSASPEDGRRLAEAIDGATFQEMKEIGHFAMAENPERFKEYLMPVLDRIAAASPATTAAR